MCFLTPVLQIPAGVQSHHKIRLSGRGIPRLNGYGSGDHYVHIKIQIPKWGSGVRGGVGRGCGREWVCVCVDVSVHVFYLLGRKLTDRQRELLEEFATTEDVKGTVNKCGKAGAEVNMCTEHYTPLWRRPALQYQFASWAVNLAAVCMLWTQIEM